MQHAQQTFCAPLTHAEDTAELEGTCDAAAVAAGGSEADVAALPGAAAA